MLASQKERKSWTGLHLGYEIFITCLQEQGHTLPRDQLLHPGGALKCTSSGGLGAPHHRPSPGPPLPQRLLREEGRES